jgi:hypothetical protein
MRVRDYKYSIGVLLLIVLLIAGGCSYAYTISPTTAQQKVQDAGYTNVQIGARHVFTAEMRCGKGYVAYFDFTATSPTGVTVHGRICKGELLQGWRINY